MAGCRRKAPTIRRGSIATSVFVIDPIDGTIAFLKNRPHFTICAAVVTGGRPCCGVVYNPASEELYAARVGGGAHRNGAPIQVGAREALEGCAMLGDRSQLTRRPGRPCMCRTATPSPIASSWWPTAAPTPASASPAKRDWDLAAADIILTEAGGRLTDAGGAALIYNRPAALQPSLVGGESGLACRDSFRCCDKKVLSHFAPIGFQ